MALAQPLGQRRAHIGVGQSQLIRQGFGGRIEIGEMVAPPFNLTPHQIGGIAASRRSCVVSACIEQPRKGQCCLRCGGEPFGNFIAVDRQIGKAFIGQAAAQAVDPANCFILAQAARIEIELLGHKDQQPRRQRALVTLD